MEENLVEVLLQMKLAWLEVEVVVETEKAENMEQIEEVAIGDDTESRFWDELPPAAPADNHLKCDPIIQAP